MEYGVTDLCNHFYRMEFTFDLEGLCADIAFRLKGGVIVLSSLNIKKSHVIVE